MMGLVFILRKIYQDDGFFPCDPSVSFPYRGRFLKAFIFTSLKGLLESPLQ